MHTALTNVVLLTAAFDELDERIQRTVEGRRDRGSIEGAAFHGGRGSIVGTALPSSSPYQSRKSLKQSSEQAAVSRACLYLL